MRRATHSSTSSRPAHPVDFVKVARRPRRLRPAVLALSMAAAFASLPTASQNVLPVFRGNVTGTATPVTNAAGTHMVVTTTNGAGKNFSSTNWSSFSIGATNGVRIDQPNVGSMSINRVTSPNNPSQIFGTLSSNGKLVLVNQSGITVGAGAVVDTAGFTASVLGMNDADAAAGRLRFNTDGLGQANGSLQVQGNLIARGGDVVLIAPNIEVAKTAVVEAQNGTAILAAGQRVEVTGRGLEGIVMQVQAPSDRAINLGTLKGDAVGIFAGQLRHSGDIKVQGVTLDGGRVVLRALDVAEVNGTIEAKRTLNGVTSGGTVEISGRMTSLNGSIDVRGSAGGAVTVGADVILQGGQIDASGTVSGGSVQLVAQRYVEQTSSVEVHADGGSGAGGTVRVQATADDGAILSSATLSADGATGGSVVMAAPRIRLLAATVTAEGAGTLADNGGSIKIGGGRQGNDPGVPNSHDVFINNATNISASSRRNGKGGTVVVWSDGTTRFAGDIKARGGSEAGDGGFIEVSGKEGLTFSGMANAGAAHGAAGTLLLDPKNIVIQNTSGGGLVAVGLDPDPEPLGSTGNFGVDAFMHDGKLVVIDPLNDINGVDAGAVYVFDPVTGGLRGSLKGTAGSRFGEQHIYNYLNSNQLLFLTPDWDGTKGAVTFVPTATLTGTAQVSSANSFVGKINGDKVGSSSPEYLSGPSGTALLFGTPDWGGGKGAIFKVTQANALAGGVIDSDTALVGVHNLDRLGDWGYSEGYTKLSSAYYSGGQDQFLLAYSHFNQDRGAVTLGDIALPLVGVVGDNTKNFTLRGETIGDQVGFHVLATQDYSSTTDWIIGSPYWSYGGTQANAGAVSYIRASSSGTLGHASNGVIGATNSFYGTTQNSLVGDGIYVMSGQGYFVDIAPEWNVGRGAITWSSYAAPKLGPVDATISLVGATEGDHVGSNVNYVYYGTAAQLVVGSPDWHYVNGGTTFSSAGALTLVNASDVYGTVGDGSAASKTMTGTHANDYVGYDLRDYSDKGYFLSVAPGWDNNKGAITFINLNGFTPGAVGNTNSYVGTTAGTEVTGDRIGDIIIANTNHDYLLSVAPNWAGGKGAVTWMSLTAPGSGDVGASNSLVGASTTDHIGGSIATDGYGPTSVTSVIDGTGIELLRSGSYLVRAPQWNNSTGMVAFGAKTTGVSGTLTVANAPVIALVGALQNDGDGYDGDRLGANVSTDNLGNYVVVTPTWYGDKGAISWGSNSTGAKGNVDSSNSIYGTPNTYFGQSLTMLDNGHFISFRPDYGGGTGAVTVMSFAAPSGMGYIGAANSVVGTSTSDHVGCALDCGGYNIDSLQYLGGSWWSFGSANWGNSAGAITFFYTGTGSPAGGAAAKAPAGTISATGTTNLSLVGGHGVDGIFMGDLYGMSGQVKPKENSSGAPDNSAKVAVVNTQWAYNRGAVTMLDLNAMTASTQVSTANSLTGTAGDILDGGGTYVVTNGDHFGATTMWSADKSRLIITDPGWSNGKGHVAVTDWTGSAGVYGRTGSLSSATAFIGVLDTDNIGSGLVMDLGASRLLVLSPEWGNGDGAATVLSMGNVTGTVTSSAGGNSMVGLPGTGLGAGATSSHVTASGNMLVLASPDWGASGSQQGALTWIDMTNPGGQMNTSTNSVTGQAGDQIGRGGFVGLNTARYYSGGEFADSIYGNSLNVTLALSPHWQGGKGAITRITGTPLTGTTLSSANSFVGDISGAEGDHVGDFSCGSYYCDNLSQMNNGALVMRTDRDQDFQSYLTVFTADSSFTGSLAADSAQFSTSDLGSAVKTIYNSRIMLRMPN